MLLPPDGFGKRPGPEPGSGSNSRLSAQKGFYYQIESEKIKYLPSGMIVPLVLQTSGKKKLTEIAFQIQIDSESNRIEIEDWESKMGLVAPLEVRDARIEVLMVNGQKENSTAVLYENVDEITIAGIYFFKRKTEKGTCYGIKIASENPSTMKLRLNVSIKTIRRDVKPVFVFEKEEING